MFLENIKEMFLLYYTHIVLPKQADKYESEAYIKRKPALKMFQNISKYQYSLSVWMVSRLMAYDMVLYI